MIILKRVTDIQNFIRKQQKNGFSIGFVPTMGALHEGHLSLIETAVNQSDIVISSIFVNPTQFNDPADFQKYPVTIENDIYLLESAGCNVLFLPSVNEMYPDGLKTNLQYNLGYLETVLDGKYRPGHFQGVCQVVHRLLNIVTPDKLFLGQKDYQQCMVLKKLIQLVGLNTQLIICPTQRETDGLAMSSRNMRLSGADRNKAVRIYETLLFIKKEIKPGYLQDLKQRATDYLIAEGFKPDYVEIADADTLDLIENWDGKTKIVTLIAAFLNEVRLIDNMVTD